MPANLHSLVLTHCCARLAIKKKNKQLQHQHFLLPKYIYLAFNRTSVPEAHATREKHSTKPNFARQQFKCTFNVYIIPISGCQLSKRALLHVSSLIACTKNFSGMYWSHLLVFRSEDTHPLAACDCEAFSSCLVTAVANPTSHLSLQTQGCHCSAAVFASCNSSCLLPMQQAFEIHPNSRHFYRESILSSSLRIL